MKKQMTIREIREVLASTGFRAIANGTDMSNKFSRDFFLAFFKPDEIANVIFSDNSITVFYNNDSDL